MRATRLAHLSLLNFNMLIFDEEYKLCSSLYSFLNPSVTSSLLDSNILLSTLLLSIFNVFFLNVRDQVPHPYKTTGKIISLYILIFTFLDIRREDKTSSEWSPWK
jgi:hypothetical protein